MEQKSIEQQSMELPPYTRFPKAAGSWKKCIVGASVGVLLTGLIIGSILIGVYLTQKHTEAMITMSLHSKDGDNIQQTLSIDERDNLAAIFISTSKYAASVLLDYRRNIITIRMGNESRCYVLRMDKRSTPSLQDILARIQYFQANNLPPDDSITFSFTQTNEANPADLGINAYLLCRDVPTYWATAVNPQVRRNDVVIIIIK